MFAVRILRFLTTFTGTALNVVLLGSTGGLSQEAGVVRRHHAF